MIFVTIAVIGILLLASMTIGHYCGRLQRSDALVDAIHELLPKTQCAQCGHPGCLPYAQAIAQGAPINLCPPGGTPLVDRLAKLLNVSSVAGPAVTKATIAYIDEDNCIGCTKCIKACPVDAIIGGPKRAHTVMRSLCTGCDLCVAPCPTDCIVMLPVSDTSSPQHSCVVIDIDLTSSLIAKQ